MSLCLFMIIRFMQQLPVNGSIHLTYEMIIQTTEKTIVSAARVSLHDALHL